MLLKPTGRVFQDEARGPVVIKGPALSLVLGCALRVQILNRFNPCFNQAWLIEHACWPTTMHSSEERLLSNEIFR